MRARFLSRPVSRVWPLPVESLLPPNAPPVVGRPKVSLTSRWGLRVQYLQLQLSLVIVESDKSQAAWGMNSEGERKRLTNSEPRVTLVNGEPVIQTKHSPHSPCVLCIRELCSQSTLHPTNRYNRPGIRMRLPTRDMLHQRAGLFRLTTWYLSRPQQSSIFVVSFSIQNEVRIRFRKLRPSPPPFEQNLI